MSELFLIAHKVRGEPAFDMALRMCCAVCCEDPANEPLGPGCHECDMLGYWWIIPTSGHRAYPWWSANLLDIDDTYQLNFEPPTYVLEGPGPMPPDLTDHYIAKAAPKMKLAEMLGIGKPSSKLSPPPASIARRF